MTTVKKATNIGEERTKRMQVIKEGIEKRYPTMTATDRKELHNQFLARSFTLFSSVEGMQAKLVTLLREENGLFTPEKARERLKARGMVETYSLQLQGWDMIMRETIGDEAADALKWATIDWASLRKSPFESPPDELVSEIRQGAEE